MDTTDSWYFPKEIKSKTHLYGLGKTIRITQWEPSPQILQVLKTAIHFVGADLKAMKDPRSRLTDCLDISRKLQQEKAPIIDIVEILCLTDEHLVKLSYEHFTDDVHVALLASGPDLKMAAHGGVLWKCFSGNTQPFLIVVSTRHPFLDELSQRQRRLVQDLQQEGARNLVHRSGYFYFIRHFQSFSMAALDRPGCLWAWLKCWQCDLQPNTIDGNTCKDEICCFFAILALHRSNIIFEVQFLTKKTLRKCKCTGVFYGGSMPLGCSTVHFRHPTGRFRLM